VLIVVVSDVCFYRDGLAAGLSERNSAIGCDRQELSAILEQHSPHAVLIDLGTPTFLEAIELTRRAQPEAAIVGLTVIEGEDVVIVAARHGVRAFVSRDQSLEELVATVEAASTGNAVCPPTIASLLFDRVADRNLGEPSRSALTPREREIAALLEQGLTNKEIAAKLVIGPATVKNHVHNVLQKLKVHRRTEAAALLRR
jgi:two-component system nitrate/nitrite response regulator NarL